MTIKINDPKRPASIYEIEAFEEEVLNVRLPEEYKLFVQRYNGAKPESNVFEINATNESGVNQFIPLANLQEQRAQVVGRLAKKYLPIAWAEGGNYVCLNLDDGSVSFWDHEDSAEPTRLAGSFSDFLDVLRPFDPSSVKLRTCLDCPS